MGVVQSHSNRVGISFAEVMPDNERFVADLHTVILLVPIRPTSAAAEDSGALYDLAGKEATGRLEEMADGSEKLLDERNDIDEISANAGQ